MVEKIHRRGGNTNVIIMIIPCHSGNSHAIIRLCRRPISIELQWLDIHIIMCPCNSYYLSTAIIMFVMHIIGPLSLDIIFVHTRVI